MENANAAFLLALRRRMRAVRRAFGQDTVEPGTLTAAEGREEDVACEQDGLRVRILDQRIDAGPPSGRLGQGSGDQGEAGEQGGRGQV